MASLKGKILTTAFFLAAFLYCFPAGAAFICGVDLNGNGTTDDKGELQQCWLTDEGAYLCPIQTAGCTATYDPVICPNGGTLNTATDQCELAGGVTCDTGYSYDSVNDICTSTPDCGGGTLDAATDVCYQNVQCPQNFNYDSYYAACVKSPTCPSGGSYDGTYDRCMASMTVTCPTGYMYDSSLFPDGCMGSQACPNDGSAVTKTLAGDYICTTSATTSCPAGLTYTLFADPNLNFSYWCSSDRTFCSVGSYNATTDKCEAAVTSTIPSGYVWDATMGAYLGDPTCPSGTAYNTVTDQCEGAVDSYACPTGFMANAAMTGCELSKCPNGTWISDGSTYELCEASPSAINCPTGFTYSNGYCVQDPTCDSFATFDAGSHKCIYNSQYGCSTGYTYNSVTGRCEAPPVCPTGTSYDPTLDRCVAPNPATETCPLGNYPCDPTAGTCTMTYPCTTTFQTQAICAQNCDAACTSACGTDALAAFGDVYWIGQTTTSWFGITGVTGSGSDLVFYGKDVNNNYVDIEVGRVTVNGCVFSGSASYFTATADNCSSTSWGLSGISATGNQITFYGGECGQAAGTIDVSGCYIDIPQSAGQFDLTHVVGGGTSLTFSSGYSGNQPIVTLGLCQYSWSCPTCSKTDVCSYSCPDTTYTLTTDHLCVKFATCDGNGTLSTQLDVCEEVVAITCPTGYTAVGNQCQADPTCPTGSSFNATLNKCATTTGITCPTRSSALFSTQYTYDPSKARCYADTSCPTGSSSGTPYTTDICTAAFLSSSCPIGSALDTTTMKCVAQPTGYGTLDTTLDKYVYYATTSCPAGWTDSGGVCSGDPECPPGSTWQVDTVYQWQYIGGTWTAVPVPKCLASVTFNCPNGYTYGQYTDQFGDTFQECMRQNLCQPGDTVQRSANNAYYYCISSTPPDKACPLDYAYDNTLNGCFSSAVCEAGTLDTTSNLCTVTGADICSIGFTLNAATSRCEAAPTCLQPGTYSASLDMCAAQANYNCPAGYAYLNGVCYSLPDCPNGTYDSTNKACYTGIDTCTIGNYPCYTYQGSRLCSPYDCVDQANPTVTGTAQSDLTSPTNDGTVSSNGTCSGQFYVMSGTGEECGTVGTQTLFQNCCNSATAMNPLFCSSNDANAAQKASQDLCHYVGTYCAESWALIGCVQSKKVYCCFNSVLARIINEQGRNQLSSFQPNPWGDPLDPKCRGFTPEEFQMLDFSQIDLSEYFSLIQTTTSTDVQNTATQKIQQFYQNVQ